MLNKWIKIITIAIICTLPGCSTNPATGRSEFTGLLSDDGAESIGKKQHPKILELYDGIYNENGMTDYVNSIGQKLARVSDMPNYDFKFVVLNKNMVNAFAMPGGYIYIGRGILELANDEAELASVLAHEIGHITARHAQSRYSKSTLLELGGLILGEYVGYGSDQLLNLGGGMYLMSYSRDQEHQADLLSVRYLAKAGYDSKGMLRFLSHLRENGMLEAKLRDDDIAKIDETSYFDTHPATVDRMSEVESLARQEKIGSRKQESYFNKINNMIYGQRATQGFVRGQTFAHSDINVVFNFPKDYQIHNLDDRVQGEKDNSKIVFTLDTDKGVTNPINYINDIWLAQIEHNGSDLPKAININGLKGAKISTYINGSRVTLIAYHNPETKTYFNFTCVNTPDNHIAETENSVHKMTTAEKQTYREYKLKVIIVKTGDTITQLADKMPFKDFKKERFMVLNGLTETDTIKIGQKLKIVE